MLVVRVLETSEDIQRAIKEAKFDPEEVWPWAFRAVAGVSPRTSSGKKISSQLEQLLLVFVYEVSPIASVVEYSLVGDVDINERALDYIEVMFRSNSRTPNLFVVSVKPVTSEFNFIRINVEEFKSRSSYRNYDNNRRDGPIH